MTATDPDAEAPTGAEIGETLVSPGSPVGGAQVILIGVADRDFVLPVDEVLGVLAPPTPTRLPGAPAGVVGVIGIRGRLALVLDPATLLGLGAAVPGARVLLTESSGAAVGLLVDRVEVVDRDALETRSEGLDGAPTDVDVDALVRLVTGTTEGAEVSAS